MASFRCPNHRRAPRFGRAAYGLRPIPAGNLTSPSIGDGCSRFNRMSRADFTLNPVQAGSRA
jgi:hypothetical protein